MKRLIVITLFCLLLLPQQTNAAACEAGCLPDCSPPAAASCVQCTPGCTPPGITPSIPGTDFNSCASNCVNDSAINCPGLTLQQCSDHCGAVCRSQFPSPTGTPSGSGTTSTSGTGAGACKQVGTAANPGKCTKEEVGPFLRDINSACYNVGSCQLTDVMIVVNNVGVFVLGIVGSLVFLMYTISGVRWIGAAYLPGGFDENIKKGKEGLRIATIGLVIVFIAWAAITTLKNVLCREGACEPPDATAT